MQKIIKLNMPDYCEGCPCFEPVLEKHEVFHDDLAVDHSFIHCKNDTLCPHLIKHLEKEKK